MEIKGRITAKPQAKTGTSSRGFWKKAFIVVQYEDGQYPKQILLSNMDKADDFERLREGQTGTFRFDGKVRENNGNYYMDLNCWSWQLDQQQSQNNSQAPF